MLFKTPETDLHKTYISPTPTLESLSYILRNPETWPPGFHWDYNYCTSCAMGLTTTIWNLDHYKMNEAYGISDDVARSIFSEVHPVGEASWMPYLFGSRRNAVTPDMVADQIDKYLAA